MSCLRRTDVNNIIHSSEIERELSRIYRTEVHIKKDELEYVTCETAPQELVFDGGSELVANLKPEWAEKIPKISIKNILFSYEKYLKTFQNARILELESYAPMDLEVILSAVPHLMELKCTGGAITCEDSDLATWTANTECFASLECTLDEFSSVTCDGIANMIQNIKCSDNARIHIRNYKGRKFQTYCRVFESLLISSAYARKDPDQKSRWGSCEFQRTDGKIIRLFLDGPNVDD
ncbi:unnamed protein product [Caenorhabditis angaria]|uniref:Uncharacterized protein n=1 Tax=Caenorhabditis angaria TaxID=860376 RepID=A0A9P1J493_9PELO|nr:unnamed protein product [Caenorhabditis angaria]